MLWYIFEKRGKSFAELFQVTIQNQILKHQTHNYPVVSPLEQFHDRHSKIHQHIGEHYLFVSQQPIQFLYRSVNRYILMLNHSISQQPIQFLCHISKVERLIAMMIHNSSQQSIRFLYHISICVVV